MRFLVQRGPPEVQLLISDAYTGLKKAPQQVFSGATWQRCMRNEVSPYIFLRNLLAWIPQRDKAAVAAANWLIFDQPNRPSAERQLQALVE